MIRIKQRILCMGAIVSLILGAIIYIFFRPDTYISKITFELFGLEHLNKFLQLDIPIWLEKILQNYVCDMLWAYSLTVILYVIIGNVKYGLMKTFIICALFETCIEYLQKIQIISGTFDIIDIFLEILITAGTLLIIKRKEDI